MTRPALLVAVTLLIACGSPRSSVSLVRTAYRIPLQGSAVVAETHPCVLRCRSPRVRTELGYYRCLARCPYVQVHPGRCSPRDRPPEMLCIEQIAGSGTASSVSLQDLVIQAAGPQNLD